LDGPYVVSCQLIFLDDYDAFLKKYGPNFQSLINQARIATSQRRVPYWATGTRISGKDGAAFANHLSVYDASTS